MPSQLNKVWHQPAENTAQWLVLNEYTHTHTPSHFPFGAYLSESHIEKSIASLSNHPSMATNKNRLHCNLLNTLESNTPKIVCSRMGRKGRK